MLKGTIIENSLADTSLLKKVKIVKTWQAGSWILHDVLVDAKLIPEIGTYISDGPWYVHLWGEGEDNFVIIFKDNIFHVQKSDPNSFKEAVAYGKSIGIPEEQLDFPTN